MRHPIPLLVVAMLVSGGGYAATAQICHVDQTHRILAPDQFGSPMGFASALDCSGDTLIVGDPTDFAGVAYIYGFDGSEWNLVQTIRPADGNQNDQLGVSVSIDGNTAVIGAPRAGEAGQEIRSARRTSMLVRPIR